MKGTSGSSRSGNRNWISLSLGSLISKICINQLRLFQVRNMAFEVKIYITQIAVAHLEIQALSSGVHRGGQLHWLVWKAVFSEHAAKIACVLDIEVKIERTAGVTVLQVDVSIDICLVCPPSSICTSSS